jgi:preprotein translocase subunit SecE
MKWEKIKPILAYIYLVLIILIAFALFLFGVSSG